MAALIRAATEQAEPRTIDGCQIDDIVSNVPNTADLISSVSDVVGGRVRQLRLERGWKTPQQLAERCEEVGAQDLTTNSLYALESGRRDADGRRRRRVAVDELVALAYALEVSPLALLLPKENGEYPLRAGISADAKTVYEWFVGRLLPPFPEEPGTVSDEDRLRAWVLFTELVNYVPDPPAMLLDDELTKRRKQEIADEVLAFMQQAAQWLRRQGIELSEPLPGAAKRSEVEG